MKINLYIAFWQIWLRARSIESNTLYSWELGKWKQGKPSIRVYIAIMKFNFQISVKNKSETWKFEWEVGYFG